jgi:hypothetical protein
MDHAVTTLAGVLNRGTVLVSARIESPCLLVGVVEEIVDSLGASVTRRFGYAYVSADGAVTDAGPAPYLDCMPAPDVASVRQAKALPWLHRAESNAVSWIIENELPSYLTAIQPRRSAELDKQRGLVEARLKYEIERLLSEAVAAAERENLGEKLKESSESLSRKATDLQTRLDHRLELIDQQSKMSIKSPLIVTAALVLPAAMLDSDVPIGGRPMSEAPSTIVQRRSIELVLAQEHAIGRVPELQASNTHGYDILSTDPVSGQTYRIKVVAHVAETADFWVTHNEVVTGKNARPHYRIALVRLDSEHFSGGDVRYLDNPFANVEINDFQATGHAGNWHRSWTRGKAPF